MVVVADKNRLAQTFGTAAMTYDLFAHVQHSVAQCLAQRITLSGDSSRILEVGCGTGLLSRTLLKRFPSASGLFTDLSADMLDAARRSLPPDRAATRVMDGEHPDVPPASFDLVASSFAVQWFDDLPAALPRLARCLRKGGLLALALPGRGSLEEWRKACTAAGIPEGFPPYPTAEELNAALPNATVETITLVQTYGDGHAFLRALTAIGAGTPVKGYTVQSSGALRRAMRILGQPTTITWQVLILLYRAEA